MKRCPKCNDMAIYDDSIMTCPICDSELTSIQASPDVSGGEPGYSNGQAERGAGRRVVSPLPPQGTQAVSPTSPGIDTGEHERRPPSGVGRRIVQPVDNGQGRPGGQIHNERADNRRSTQTTTAHDAADTGIPRFETHLGGRMYSFRGSVAEVNSHSRYYNRFHKVVNTISQGEPYQFGHTNYETVIRVEEFTDGRLPSQARDLIMYGDIEGSVQPGDDVEIYAVRRGGRYVIRTLHNFQTGSDVVPGAQVSALVCLILVICALILVVSLGYGIVAFFTQGGFEALVMAIVGLIVTIVTKIMVAILPLLFLLFIFSLFTGIGRKH